MPKVPKKKAAVRVIVDRSKKFIARGASEVASK